MRYLQISRLIAALALTGSAAAGATDRLASSFVKPPAEARPWVYWFIMDGNLTREGITADFEAMQRAGIGGLVMMEVDAGIPKGPIAFMSPQWRELFAHAVREAERLGLQMTLNAGPGWTGSGGPWVKPEQSMQHLVASATTVKGPGPLSEALPRPERRPAYFGDGKMPAALEQAKNEYYVDVAVLTFPTPSGHERIPNIEEKALYERAPYSSKPGVKAFLPTQGTYPPIPSTAAIAPGSVIDLSGRLGPDGRLSWDVPPGDWTILRFGRTSTGANTRPAPAPGVGLESDKFDRKALDAHFEAFVGALLQETGSRRGKKAGWTSLHIDSWEMGAQNWTARFREEFQARRRYDPTPYLPAMTARVVGSTEISERFLWDLRQTAQELVIENHAEHLKELGKRQGLGLSIEPYDMNPCADLSLGAVADVPMCEFWLYGFDATYSVIEAASVAHTWGKRIVAAEAFTSSDAERWQAYPGSMKGLGDWAFCSGVNRIVFHRYQHQPSLDRWPGMTMGPYGVHWERTQTWWDMAPAYHTYLARCQLLLRRGLPVADVCFLAAEGAPHVFRPPPSALHGNPPDHPGYPFDGCAPERLVGAMKVSKGRLVLPGGASYSLLVLPESPTMTPRLLRKVKQLVEAGATVIGPRPVRSPSLSGYPACDEQVRQLAAEVWGDCDGIRVREHRLGRGRVIWEQSVETQPVEPLARARWIWYPEGNPGVSAPAGKRYFRRSFNLENTVSSANLAITADNAFTVWLNGTQVGHGDNFTRTYITEVTPFLVSGTNNLAVEAVNAGEDPAGLIAELAIRSRNGEEVEVVTDRRWEAAKLMAGDPGGKRDATIWSGAMELGAFDAAPWSAQRKLAPEQAQYGDFRVVERMLNRMGVSPDFESDRPLRFTHRRDGRTEIYFVANPGEDMVVATCRFRTTSGTPELWNAITGEIRELTQFTQEGGRTVVPLNFAPYESFFVLFRSHRRPSSSGMANFRHTRTLLEVTGPWEVSFDPRWGGPERVSFAGLESWTRHPEEGIRFYSGKATYRKALQLLEPVGGTSRLYLDLGVVKNLAHVRLNGTDLGVVWCAPWRVEITGAVKPGTNRLEIEVANLWPNRLIRDAGLLAEKRLTATTWNPFTPDTPLLESGLIGPVTIAISAEQ